MANFSESLTIRILGDSSHLEGELKAASDRISELQAQLSRLGAADREAGRLHERFASIGRPLENLSRLLDKIANQVRGLSRIPVSINVAPALQSLSLLAQMAAIVAARLRALSVGSTILGGASFSAPRAVPRLASGGLVRGPGGIDQVPALLTSGEFVVRRDVVQQLGVGFLQALNQPAPRSSTLEPRAMTAPVAATNNNVTNFGGVSIHVSRPADVNAIVRDLRLQGFRLRNRRG